MDVYLPIANLSVNGLVIVALGALTGILSGMFGVGGGFLATPLLIFYGVPPTVSAASAASQVTGASVSGVFAHTRRGGVDFQMGGVLVAGGILGTAFGAILFRLLQDLGQIDTVINILYVLLLGWIGTIMARESIQVLRAERTGEAIPARKAASPSAGREHAAALAVLSLGALHFTVGAAAAGLRRKRITQIAGMIEMRVDMIVVVCALIDFLLSKYQFEQIKVSSYSLKEGVLASMAK